LLMLGFVSSCASVPITGRSRRERGGMGPGIGARGRLRPGGRGRAQGVGSRWWVLGGPGPALELPTRSPRGTVFCSFSFGDVPVNNLTGGGYGPITDMAELKVCPVRIEKADARVG